MSLKENEEKMVDLCLLIIQCLEVKTKLIGTVESFLFVEVNVRG